jgi:hypothetical protein
MLYPPAVTSAHAIEAGHFVCVKLDSGTSAHDVANDVLNSSSMPEFHAGFFVGASIDVYCPRHKVELPSSWAQLASGSSFGLTRSEKTAIHIVRRLGARPGRAEFARRRTLSAAPLNYGE